jgi:hypothetical protein
MNFVFISLFVQGFFSGQYHSVVGKIKRESTGEVLYDISGIWTEELFIKGKVKRQIKKLFKMENCTYLQFISF